MYIEKTTAADRLIIERALDDAFVSLDRGCNLLLDVISTYFGNYEKEPITARDAEDIASKLEIVGDIVFDAILNYSLTVGRGDFRGVAPYLESADRAALAVKVEKQLVSVFPGVERAEIMALPDEQATAILEKGGIRL